MLPDSRELAKEMQGKPFTLIGINSDQSRSALKEIMAKENITWPNIYDGAPGAGPIGKKWNVQGWPTLVLIDHEGIIRYRGHSGEEMEKLVRELVPKAMSKSESSGKPEPAAPKKP